MPLWAHPDRATEPVVADPAASRTNLQRSEPARIPRFQLVCVDREGRSQHAFYKKQVAILCNFN